MESLGERIKVLREDRGWTQKELAQRSRITKSAISFYELGERKPSCDVLRILSRVFRVTSDYLLGMEKTSSLSLDGLSENDKRLICELVASLANK